MPRSSDLTLPSRPLRLFAAAVVALAITALVVAVLTAIGQAATEQTGGTPSQVDIWQLLRMTTIQAGLTTILSLIVGTLLAWSLNRLSFPGRGILVGLFASAIVTPGIIVAFGLLTVWGRSGWVAEITEILFGTPLRVPLYGLGGILAAHVILDGALAARVLLARLDTVPSPRLKTGQSLGLSAWRRFAVIDWPAIRGAFPGLAAIIFLLAFTSFPIVLLLGGGPANQTLEVAIYSAVRLNFDLAAAVRLAVVQIVVCGAIILVASALAPVPSTLGRAALSSWRDRAGPRLVQWLILIACTAGFGLPLVAVLVGGIGPGLTQLIARETFWAAVTSSLVIATASATLTLILALAITMGRATTTRPLFRVGVAAPAYAYLAVPAVALALGFFLIVREMGLAPGRAAPVVIVIANALLALPFALATLAPPLEAIARTQGRLIRSLGLSGRRQFALIEWPLIGRDIGIVLALAFCFSLGDLGVIALFGTQDFATLPLLMLRALGSYRTADAASVAAIMLALTIAAFVILPRLVERLAHARA